MKKWLSIFFCVFLFSGSALAAGVDFALATWGCPTPRPEPYKYAPAEPLALLDVLRASNN